MTANTSPRLALMLPVNSDPFDPNDFVDTFTKIDARPGVQPIANFGALPVGLTAAQHGNLYLQLDNLAEWMWYRPTSGVSGVWKRTNTVGVLSQVIQASSISTTATTPATGAVICSTTVTAPGGRWIGAHFYCDNINNSNNTDFSSGVSLFINGTQQYGHIVLGDKSATSFPIGNGASIHFYIPPPAAGASLAVQIKLSTVHGGTSQAQGPATLTIFEQ